MDKNVSGVDLEELMKVREELDREKGIETDPNMYSDYNPNRNATATEFENSSEDVSFGTQDELNETEQSVQNNSYESQENVEKTEEQPTAEIPQTQNAEAEKDFGVYDMFSAFEVNDGEKTANEDNNQTSSNMFDINLNSDPIDVQSETLEVEDQESTDLVDNSHEDEIDAEIERIVNEIADVIGNNEKLSREDEYLTEPLTSTNNEIQLESLNDFTDTETESSSEVQANENLADPVENQIAVEENEAQSELQSTEKPVENEQNTTTVELENTMQIATDFNQLKDMLEQELESTTKEEETKLEKIETEIKEVKNSEFNFGTINEYKFVEKIGSEEFKETDKLSFILGLDENNAMVYGNFREHYNFVVFGKEEMYTNNVLNSVILSLSLKNSVEDVNFVICDPKSETAFECYNNSSYMYFNRVAKTNKEILDTLIEVSKELEDRYGKLAVFGVKSLDMYNQQANVVGAKTLPRIIIVFNNYSKSAQISDSDRINTCLHQILKFGRMVGIHVVIASKGPISSEEINYNLPSRIALKSDEDSVYTLGESGANCLADLDDALFASISNESVVHLKVPSITNTEVELLINNLED